MTGATPGQQQLDLPLGPQTSLLFQPLHGHTPCEGSSICPAQVPSWSPGYWEKLPQPCSCPLYSSIFPITYTASDPSLCLQWGHLFQPSSSRHAQEQSGWHQQCCTEGRLVPAARSWLSSSWSLQMTWHLGDQAQYPAKASVQEHGHMHPT